MVRATNLQFDVDERGKAIKICSIIDERTRKCLGGLVERSITAERFIEHVEDIIATRGMPTVLRSDNYPEFISNAVTDWAASRMGLSYIPPGQP